MSDSPLPTCWIIAGPNGAGKTTFALRYLPEIENCQNFINADLIAAGLAPLAPESQLVAASRLFLAEINARVQAREDFAFETTLAGRSLSEADSATQSGRVASRADIPGTIRCIYVTDAGSRAGSPRRA